MLMTSFFVRVVTYCGTAFNTLGLFVVLTFKLSTGIFFSSNDLEVLFLQIQIFKGI
jgi:hypothetical protein